MNNTYNISDEDRAYCDKMAEHLAKNYMNGMWTHSLGGFGVKDVGNLVEKYGECRRYVLDQFKKERTRRLRVFFKMEKRKNKSEKISWFEVKQSIVDILTFETRKKLRRFVLE